MTKRIYNSPRVEATPLTMFGSIMITSIGMDGNNLPAEPGKTTLPAPKHRTPVF